MSNRRQRSSNDRREDPFDISSGIFGGRDPFSNFGGIEDMMGGDPFSRMDQMFEGFGFDSGSRGRRGIADRATENALALHGSGEGDEEWRAARGRQGAMVGRAGGGGGGSSHVMVMSSTSVRGSDGKLHKESYQSSKVYDGSRRIAEGKELYSNSSTGVEKIAHERHMGERGRKIVKERNRASNEERVNDMLRGMERDEEVQQFDRDWDTDAKPFLRQAGGRRRMEDMQSHLRSLEQGEGRRRLPERERSSRTRRAIGE